MAKKALVEKRNAIIAEMEALTDKASEEVRAFTEEENTKFSELKSELEGLDVVLKASEESRSLEVIEPEQDEVRAFEMAIRSGDLRAMAKSDNGAVVPEVIAQRIIKRTVELAPVLQYADVYYIAGKLVFPTDLGTTTAATYVNENTAVAETSDNFGSIALTGYIMGVATEISKDLINNAQFDLLGYIVEKVAERLAWGLNKEFILGTTGKIGGIVGTTNTLTAENAARITAEDLLDLQTMVPQIYQQSCIWIMAPSTFRAIRKLKDTSGQYLLAANNGGFANGTGYSILGRPVFVDDNMPAVAGSAKTVVYGDLKGYAVKFSDKLDLGVFDNGINRKYGYTVTAFADVDGQIVDNKRIACLVQATPAFE